MTETTTPSTEPVAPTARQAPARPTEPTGWVGWIMFGGVMMIIVGALQAIYGFIALVNDEWVVWGNQANLYIDLSTWGWVHLIGGGIVLAAGIGLFTGNVLARAVAVVVASLSLIANFLSMPAYPVWSLVMIGINVLVIWAVVAHGREVIDLR